MPPWEVAAEPESLFPVLSSFGIVAKKLALHQMRSALEPKVVTENCAATDPLVVKFCATQEIVDSMYVP